MPDQHPGQHARTPEAGGKRQQQRLRHPAAVMAGQIFIKQHNSKAGCIHKKQGNKHVRISFLWMEAGLI